MIVRADNSTARHSKDNRKNVTKTASKDSKKESPEESQTKCTCRGNDKPNAQYEYQA
jgi:hypothetical protein